jgi:hypothetical protein
MTTKAKTFDCVEMKRQAQAELLAEWENRKNEFSSFGEFVDAAIQESEWARRMLEKTRRDVVST